ncbi:PASTA domain-containing protein [Baekduia alba]|uniref:PASTA domain-containing protein n=1 Tax=Baekduia alba TaxID=2997333 RepID=UPI00233FCC6D|nr:PASTA domain-containing protein [Baekduia alba]
MSGRHGRTTLGLSTLLAVMGIWAGTAGAATYTWVGGSGSYIDAAHWSSPTPGTLPGSTDDVVIAGSTDYTVSYVGPPGVQRSVASLTLGGGSTGTQTLAIKTAAGTGDGRLEVNGNATISSHGQVIIDQDASGLSSPGNTPQLNVQGAFANAGTIVARNEGTVDRRIASLGAGTLTNTGTLHVTGGDFTIKHVVNAGAIVVDPGALLYVTSGGGATATGVTQNAGTVINHGDIYIASSLWAQNGGALTGNPIRIGTGGLADSGGTGTFIVNGNGTKISGTIPAGQTVQLGNRAEEMSNYFSIQAPGLTVAPGGTLVVDPSPANGAGISDNPITVQGTLQVKAGGTSGVDLDGGLTVAAGGTLDLQSGSLRVRRSPVNHGTVAVAPDARMLLNGDGTTTFTTDGTLAFAIASPTSFGAIARLGQTPAALAGTVSGVLVGGYVPATGTAFKVIDNAFSGAFGAVGGGFAAQYAGDGSSVSLVYGGPAGGGAGGGASIVTPPKPAPTPAPKPNPTRGVRCVVPDLKNKTLADAKAALKKAHCALGAVHRPRSRAARRKATRVVAQTRKAGAQAARGTKVTVTMGKPVKKAKRKHK